MAKVNLNTRLELSSIVFTGLILLLAATTIFGITLPPWGDESHFVETVRLFGHEFNLSTLRHYKEMSTPLPFILYAGWGRLFSFDLPVLRLLSLIIAFLTYAFFYDSIEKLDVHRYTPLLVVGWLVINPYMIGLGLFVFPDMLAILFVILSIRAVFADRIILLAVFNGLGLLCRQYFAFVTLAAFCLYGMRYMKSREPAALRALAWLSLSVVPCLALFTFWGGVSPDNELKFLYLNAGFEYHLSFTALYLALLFLFPAPFILYRWRVYYSDRKVLAGAFVLAWIYWLFPVRAAAPALADGVDTVGFTHRLLSNLFSQPFVDDIFFVLFFLSLPVLYNILQSIWSWWRYATTDPKVIANLLIVSFLIVMPFSYLCWEKYFLLVLPAVLVRSA